MSARKLIAIMYTKDINTCLLSSWSASAVTVGTDTLPGLDPHWAVTWLLEVPTPQWENGQSNCSHSVELLQESSTLSEEGLSIC